MNSFERLRSRAGLRREFGPDFVAWLATHRSTSRKQARVLFDAALPLAAALRRARLESARARTMARRRSIA